MDWGGLLGRVQEGDGAAWHELVRRFHPTLLRYLHGRGIPSPEDVAADVWLQVHRGLSGLASDGDEDHFRRWLIAIAHHRVGDLCGWVPQFQVEVLRPLPQIRVGEEPENVVIARGALLDAIDGLGTRQGEVVRLRLLGGLSHAEIATLLNMTPAAVRQAYSRALPQLGKGL